MAISLPIVSSFDNKGIRRARGALQSFANFAVDVGKIAAGAVSAVAVAGVREAADFERSFATIRGLVGLSADEVAKLEKAAREIGPAYGIAATEAADALFFITSAGLRGADATEVLESSAKASAAGLGDLNAIANTATAAMNTYGPSVLSGTDAVAALTEAVRLGQFAPEELASSLGQVIPISSELGVSFEETTGLIAALTKGGLPASQAVTGIRGAMQALLKPTTEAKDMLAEYGFSTEDVRSMIEDDGLLATFSRLRESFGENEEDFTRVVGSIEGLNAVLSLTGENHEAYSEIVDQMTDDVQILDEAFGAVSDTASQKFDVAMATSREILLGIGEDLLERLIPHLESFGDFMEENGPEIEAVFDNIFEAVEEVATAVGDFIQDLAENENFQTFLGDLQQWFKDTWPEVEELVGQIGELALQLAPVLMEATKELLPSLSALVSILDNIAFFANEAAGGTDDMNVSLSKFVPVIGAWVGEDGLLVKFANGLDEIREAYERLMAIGLDITPDFLKDGPISVRLVPGSLTPGESGLTGDLPGAVPDHLGFSGARAMGGLVTGGQMYSVGERGPEMFVPAQNGSIIPNDQLGGPTYNITVNAGMGTDGPQVAEQIVRLIRRYERNSGPVFARA